MPATPRTVPVQHGDNDAATLHNFPETFCVPTGRAHCQGTEAHLQSSGSISSAHSHAWRRPANLPRVVSGRRGSRIEGRQPALPSPTSPQQHC